MQQKISDENVGDDQTLTLYYKLKQTAYVLRWVSGSGGSLWAGVAHRAAVADGVVEAAVAGVTGVAAGQRVTQTELLVRDAAARGTHGSALQLQRRQVLQDKGKIHSWVNSVQNYK